MNVYYSDDQVTLHSWRDWLANRLHLWAERIRSDFHTVELINKRDGSRVSFSCHWQWIASWHDDDYDFDCSCENAELM